MFLNLPREIRDVIYGLLYREVRYHCTWSRDHDMHELNLAVVDINVENAPLYDVLLVSRQVHDEYKEDLQSRRFSATVATKPFPKQHPLQYKVSDKEHMDAAVSHLSDVKLLILNNFPGHGFWTIVASLAEFVVSKASNLQTIQIGTKLDSPRVAIHRDVHRPEYWAAYETATHPMFRLESPPAFIAEDFALSVYGEGYHSGYAKIPRLNKLILRSGETDMDARQYFVARMGLYVYARAGESVKLINKSTLVEQWPTSGFLWSSWTIRQI
jgi:hypothetical protein